MAKRQISEPSTTALREQWLHALATKMKPIIDAKASIEIPAYRVACGFPSKGESWARRPEYAASAGVPAPATTSTPRYSYRLWRTTPTR